MEVNSTTAAYTFNEKGSDVTYSLKSIHNNEPESEMHTAMVIVGILAIAGIIGNVLVLYVFSGQRQKPTSTVFILTLACTDFITSILTMPFTIVVEVLHFKVEYDIVCKLYQFLITSTIPFSAFIMVAIAVDRYLCIVHPFKRTMTMERAKSVVALLAILAVMLGVLCCLMYGVYKVTEVETFSNCTAFKNTSNELVHLLNISTDLKMGDALNCSILDSKSVNVELIVNTGYCQKDQIIFDASFFNVFQKILFGLFWYLCSNCDCSIRYHIPVGANSPTKTPPCVD